MYKDMCEQCGIHKAFQYDLCVFCLAKEEEMYEQWDYEDEMNRYCEEAAWD